MVYSHGFVGGSFDLRRIIIMVVDLGTTSHGLAVLHELAAPWFPIYLWVVIGNGIRYGQRYLLGGIVLSVVGFAVVLLINEFWQRHLGLGLGLMCGLIVVPSYVAMLLNALNVALEQSKQANAAKSRFVANMSHELRTPLHGILNVTNFLTHEDLTPSQRRRVGLIYECAKALSEIVGRVLNLSRLEARQFSLDNRVFDLYEVISRTMNLVALEAEAKHVSLRVEVDPGVPCLVEGDSERVRDILMNFVSNAVKFTEHGYVRVQARVVKTGHLLAAVKKANGAESAYDFLITEADQQSLAELGHALDLKRGHRLQGGAAR
ncbi:MAG: hypothetical protein DRQ37_05490 [Gammaproteobacteria bacterium]|nr:MAG: hypothetical protein DRQ37_05490 [Gammaproteobacteria bacterium]